MGTVVYAQPTKLDQVKGVLRLGDFKPPPEQAQPETFTLDDAYGPPANQVAGPAAPATPPDTFSIDDAYHGAPDESVGGVTAQFGSGAVRGLASLPGLPADLLTLGFRGAEYLGGVKPEDRKPQDQLPWAPFGSDTFRTMAERNLPLAKRDESGGLGSYAETVGEFAGPTALAGLRTLSGATGAVARGAAASPGRVIAGETLAAVGGGTGAEAARQGDPNNPWLPVVGGLAGSIAPGGIASATRGFVRGGQAGANRVNQALQDFGRLGETPTLSQATSGGYSAGQLFSRVMEFTPGGYLPSRARIARQINAASTRLDNAIANAQPSEVAAGDALRAGAHRFADKIQRTQAVIEARLDRAVPAQTIVEPNETLQALQRLYEPAAAGPGGTISEVGAGTISPTARDMLQRLLGDLQQHNGTPFGSLRAFRTRLGASTSGGQPLIRDLSEAETHLLYGAITRDMEHAADANGAGNIVRLRNSYYSQRKTQTQQVFDRRIPSTATAEAAYRSVKNSDASQLRQIMKQLTPQQRRVVAGQVLQEMGMPPPSGAAGETQRFSFESFDTNWEKLNRKGSLDALFRFSGTQDLRAALDDIAEVAERVKGSENFLRNPSGTAPIGIQVAGLSSVGTQIIAGNPTGALFMAGLVYGLPYALVRGGNSRAFLRLIADTGRATESTLPGHLARMAEFVRLNPEYAPVVKQMLQHAQEPQQDQQPTPPNGQAAWNGSGGPLESVDPEAPATPTERVRNAPAARFAPGVSTPQWELNNTDRRRGPIYTQQQKDDLARAVATDPMHKLTPQGPADVAQRASVQNARENFSYYKPGEVSAYSEGLENYRSGGGAPLARVVPSSRATQPILAQQASQRAHELIDAMRVPEAGRLRAMSAHDRIQEKILRDTAAALDDTNATAVEDDRMQTMRDRLANIFLQAKIEEGAKGTVRISAQYLSKLRDAINATQHPARSNPRGS